MENDITVIQLGEGKLLRTLIDPIIYNTIKTGWKGKIVVTNLTKNGEHNIDKLKQQNGNYCIILRTDNEISKNEINIIPLSLMKDWRKLNCYMEKENIGAIISNSTEAGFVIDKSKFKSEQNPKTYIGILCSLLFSRFNKYSNSYINVFPTELLENNGTLLHDLLLKQSHLWELKNEYNVWLNSHVRFINTLVDRIVTDMPSGNEYYGVECRNKMVSIGEKYGKWWIESSKTILSNFPIYEINEVELVNNIENYYRMKVWILNGAHLFIACYGLINGFKTVSETYKENNVRKIVLLYWNEIKEFIGVSVNDINEFIDNTDKRFKQEWLNHQLKSIAVNISEKWHARIEPAIKEYYVKKGHYNDTGLLMTAIIATYISKNENIDIENAINLLIDKESHLRDLVLYVFNKKIFKDFK